METPSKHIIPGYTSDGDFGRCLSITKPTVSEHSRELKVSMPIIGNISLTASQIHHHHHHIHLFRSC